MNFSKLSLGDIDVSLEDNDVSLEFLIVKGFISWLDANGYSDISKIFLEGGEIIGRNRKIVVQWDGMVEAYKGDKCYLFMIDVKDTAHINHILKDKCERTKNFLKELKSTDMALTSKLFQIQRILFSYDDDFELIFVYGSRTICQEIIDDIKTLSCKINTKIWYCDYNQQCHVNEE
jgi:hypothetical protein